MQIKSQPWIHSWYGDSFSFFLIPITFVVLAFFKFPPFGNIDQKSVNKLITWVLIIDWAHIFAQWHRIYTNPLESKKGKWVYPLSYLLLIPLLGWSFQFGIMDAVESFLVYFVIFHFIKQHFGFIRIYSKIDGPKTKFESMTESALIYLCMWTPVLYWHTYFPKQGFYWTLHFVKHPYVQALFWPAIILYAFTFGCYVFAEGKRWKRNGIINWPKNLAILTSALGWGLVSIFVEAQILIFFTVILTHDLSYTFFVWIIGRRDDKIRNKKVPWFSWFSIPGFFIYLFAIIFISQIVMATYAEMAHDLNRDYLIVGKFFNNLPSSPGWWQEFGAAFFFGTQAHHYFIDKYLWKKEKDLAYMVNTGRYAVEKAI
jgi:hypothetical protein